MHLFFSNTILNDQIELDLEESRHLSKVLRLKNGDLAEVIDGKGNLFHCKVLESNSKKSRLNIEKKTFKDEQFGVHLAVAPPKNLSRWEWFLEKSTEIGIDQISPIRCERSERKILKRDRQMRILISAMKQSLKTRLPQLDELQDFETFIQKKNSERKYIAHCREELSKMNLAKLHPKGKKALILIGPEGDFTKEEILKAEAAGFDSVSLGKSRLRTETAALIACHTINLSHA